MGEPAGDFDFRRFLLIAGVVAVVIAGAVVLTLRGCATGGPLAKKPGYTLIYTNLELKDAANVIARLKELAIPYEIRDDGRAIAVPKDKADQARLGLAEKNLPAGGAVGWEIFDQSRMGATDFDRRIQLIRAISGELSRTIRRINGVDDVRVQIVIPETKLFAVTSAPVTASVLLRLRPGIQLTRDKVNGIIYLVASSVENLQPENVTVVDESGRILSAIGEGRGGLTSAPPPAATVVDIDQGEKEEISPEATITTSTLSTTTTLATSTSKEVTVEVKVPFSSEVSETLNSVPTLTAEDKILLKTKAKKDLEQELSSKAQTLLNRFYPLNSVITKVGVVVAPTKNEILKARDIVIKRLYIVVLVDNRVKLTAELKKATYTTVAGAVGYNRQRGDKIVLQSVPFRLAAADEDKPVAKEKTFTPLPAKSKGEALIINGSLLLAIFERWSLYLLYLAGGIVTLLVLIVILRRVFRRKLELEFEPPPVSAPPIQPVKPVYREEPRNSIIEQVKNSADNNPEKIAELLKKWLGE